MSSHVSMQWCQRYTFVKQIIAQHKPAKANNAHLLDFDPFVSKMGEASPLQTGLTMNCSSLNESLLSSFLFPYLV